MELFEQTQREYRFGVGTVRDVARQLGVHRRMLRQALSAVLPDQQGSGTSKSETGAGDRAIDEILRMDEHAPREHRHTAHRIWDRIGEERPEFGVAESAVRHRWQSVTRRRERAAEGRS